MQNLVRVKSPRSELHLARLFVERKILDADWTRTAVDGRWDP